MEINLPILALMKMVLDAYRTNPVLDKCKQISQFIAQGNGFGCVQKNQSYQKMEINLPILALMKMVLEASKTNPLGKWKSIDRCVQKHGCVQNQSLDKCK